MQRDPVRQTGDAVRQTGFEAQLPEPVSAIVGAVDAAQEEFSAGEGLEGDGSQVDLPDWPRLGAEEAEAVPPGLDDGDAGAEQYDRSAPSPIVQGNVPPPAPPGVAGSDEDTPAQKRLRAQLVRPFKRIDAIRPYFDYEPDAETQKLDRCYNLCPRPGSPECPECESSNGEPLASACPECPVELDLRDSSRFTGQSLDYPIRNFPHIHYCWEPTNLYSLPLYFQDPCLERYGHTRHYLIQPVFSGALFAAQFLGLPYQMSIDPMWKKRYALGWYRPGQYVPYKYYQVPWNTQAALTEAGVITGAYFLFAPGVSP
ncbi:MAG: hypothetical protein ACT4QC_09970 [Planctomycetaceae bacterium]